MSLINCCLEAADDGWETSDADNDGNETSLEVEEGCAGLATVCCFTVYALGFSCLQGVQGLGIGSGLPVFLPTASSSPLESRPIRRR